MNEINILGQFYLRYLNGLILVVTWKITRLLMRLVADEMIDRFAPSKHARRIQNVIFHKITV